MQGAIKDVWHLVMSGSPESVRRVLSWLSNSGKQSRTARGHKLPRGRETAGVSSVVRNPWTSGARGCWEGGNPSASARLSGELLRG